MPFVEDWLALSLLPLGPLPLARALERHGDPADIAYRVPAAALTRSNDSARKLTQARATLERRVRRELKLARRHGIAILTRGDREYPAALLETADPPPALYVRGRLAAPAVRVALVGSRAASRYGERVAAEFAGDLAGRGVEVVSGGARGIDAAAHRGALAAGGRTVALLGAGLLRPYPPEHARLFDEIARAGAVVSEYPLEAPPDRWRFPRRNRLIAGLSAAVVVVEAAERSGALSTVGHALDQGREVMAVPGPVTTPRSVGGNRLIREGAAAVLTANDIVDELPPLYRDGLARNRGARHGERVAMPDDLTADEVAVLGLLDVTEAAHLDQLAGRARLDVARLQAALFGLQLRGTVERLPGRYYVLRPKKDDP